MNVLRDAVTEARAVASGTSAAHGQSNATSSTQSDTWSSSTAEATSTTWKQTLVPRMAWRDVVRSIQFFTAEEQFIMAASKLASLDTGHAIMYVSGRGATQVVFPHLRDPYERVPVFGRKVMDRHRAVLIARPDHNTIEAIDQHRSEVLQALMGQLNMLIAGELPAPHILRSVPSIVGTGKSGNGEILILREADGASDDHLDELETGENGPWEI
jgi:hypothetical protein